MAEINNDIPENVRKTIESNPELVRSLANPEFIEQITKSMENAAFWGMDWCFLCGASSSKAIPAVPHTRNPLTAADIRAMGEQLLSYK